MTTTQNDRSDYGEPTYYLPDYREYAPETIAHDDGTSETLQVCEELVNGRWEGFVSIIRAREEA